MHDKGVILEISYGMEKGVGDNVGGTGGDREGGGGGGLQQGQLEVRLLGGIMRS